MLGYRVLCCVFALVVVGGVGVGDGAPRGNKKTTKVESTVTISRTKFSDRPKSGTYNASGVVSLGDSKFLICDNKTTGALFELDLTADGKQAGPLKRRPLEGAGVEAPTDLEGITSMERDRKTYFFVL